MILSRKRRLRLFIRQQTALVPRIEKLRQAHEAFTRLEGLDTFRKANRIGLFWSLSDEIPTQPFIETWAERKDIYLPVIDGKQMHFARFTPECTMVEGGMRILVPDGTPRIDPDRLDLLIVPGVAFSPDGGRLGRGLGYYDRFMDNSSILTVGMCLEHQLMGSLPLESHDRPVNIVITSSGTFLGVRHHPEPENETRCGLSNAGTGGPELPQEA